MIKFGLFFIFVALAKAAIDNPEASNLVSSTLDKCIKQEDVSRDVVMPIWNTVDFPEDNADFTKFLTCVITELGILKGNEIQMEKLMAIVPNFLTVRFNMDIEEAKKILAKVDKNVCLEIPKVDTGLYGIRARNCLMQEVRKHIN